MKWLFSILFLFPTLCYGGDLTLSYSNYRGEVDGYSLSGKIQDTSGPISFYAEYGHGEAASIVTKDMGEVGLDYNPKFTERLSLWFDYKVGYNKVNNINYESFVGFGPKYYLYKKGESKLSF